MSAAIRIARLKAEYRGDPGLFDFIGKAVGGIAKVAGNFLPGPIGTIAKVAGNLLAPAPKAIAQSLPMSTAGKPLNPSLFPVIQRSLPQIPVQVDSTRTSGVSLFPGGPMVGTQTTYSSPAGHPGGGCGAGYHMNKAGYYTRQGYVAPGTRCVKNRKRNPLNPRAASRAMGRLTSAKKATRSILKFFGDGKRRAAPSSSPIGRRKCGCK